MLYSDALADKVMTKVCAGLDNIAVKNKPRLCMIFQ